MVTTPTLLVLGAGASLHYGFQLGHDLLRQIAANIIDSLFGPTIAQASNSTALTVLEFAHDLRQSRRSSIDAFIESRAADYDAIGRCAIAHHLLLFESDDTLFPAIHLDWYSALFDAILGNSPEAFRTNQLRVITFNFDRSFERALYLALCSNFGDRRASELLAVLPILHVHGDLGDLPWAERDGTPHVRLYEPGRTLENIRACSERIKIIHHDIPRETRNRIREWFGWVRRVYFIGFSYHESNLVKLGIPGSLEGKTAVGTIYGMGPGQLSRMRRLAGNTISAVPAEWTAVDAVRQYDWFYEG